MAKKRFNCIEVFKNNNPTASLISDVSEQFPDEFMISVATLKSYHLG